MRELSMHVLDLVQNSIRAKADVVKIKISEDHQKDNLTIKIIDNGYGIPKDILHKVSDPFVTERKTRKVGLGLSLIDHAAKLCDGDLEIESSEGKGTTVTANFKYSHINRVPIGNMTETLITLICANPEIDYIYKYSVNNSAFVFDTKQIKKHIREVPINNIEIIDWLSQYINDGIMGVLK